MPVSLARAISPTTMITILPVGWLLYTGGSLPIETFITTIVLSLGIAGPLLAAMDFVDSLAKVGTIVGSVDAILDLRAEWYFVEDASIIADEHEGYTRTVLPHPEGG